MMGIVALELEMPGAKLRSSCRCKKPNLCFCACPNAENVNKTVIQNYNQFSLCENTKDYFLFVINWGYHSRALSQMFWFPIAHCCIYMFRPVTRLQRDFHWAKNPFQSKNLSSLCYGMIFMSEGYCQCPMASLKPSREMFP